MMNHEEQTTDQQCPREGTEHSSDVWRESLRQDQLLKVFQFPFQILKAFRILYFVFFIPTEEQKHISLIILDTK